MIDSRILDALRAYRNAKKYSAFLNGVDVSLATGSRLRLQITRITPIKTASLYQLYPYTYVTEVTAGDFRELGCGEAHHPLLAIQKSISEAVERCLFRGLKGTPHGTATSNGWAAHVSVEKAREAALFELLERDAVLVHALREIPLLELQPDTLPGWLKEWSQRELRHTEFSRLRVLLSTQGHVPSISVAFTNSAGYGVVAHAADASIGKALSRALAETCRIGRIALSGNYRLSSADLFLTDDTVPTSGPCEQAVAYAHHRPFPQWMFDASISWADATASWSRRLSLFNANPIPFEFVPVLSAPIAAGYCVSTEVQNLFFGRTHDADRRGELNKNRLMQVKPTGEHLSVLPHFVA